MDGNDLPVIGFNERAFWGKANVVLAKGTREMLLNAKDMDRIVGAYDRMDCALGELVERMDPHYSVREQLYKKVEDRIALLSRMLENRGADVGEKWETDMKKVAVIVLNAFGRTEDLVSIPRLVDDATAVLCRGNFTEQGAVVLMAEMSTYKCRGLADMLKHMQDSPAHMDFLRLLEKEGMPRAKKAARKTLDRMMPMTVAATIKEPVRTRMAEVIQLADFRRPGSIRRPQAPTPARRAYSNPVK